MKKIVLLLIKAYQKTLSLDSGWLAYKFPHGYCRYYPNCSEYGYQAINEFGLKKGIIVAFLRVIRCHPWAKGGVDQLNIPKINK